MPKIISDGWDFIVLELDNGSLIRIPRTDTYKPLFKKEVQLLNKLQSKIDLQIPHYHLHDDNGVVGMYQKIEGVTLTKEIYQSLDNIQKDNLAKTLALFFYQLHTSISMDAAKQLGYGIYKPDFDLDVPDEYKSLWTDIIKLKNNLREPDFVVIHNDVHCDNMIIKDDQLVGIIDFSEATIADRFIDLKKLYLVDFDLLYRTVDYYAEHIGEEDTDYMIKCTIIYYLQSRFMYLRDLPEKKDEILRHIKDFISVIK